MTLDAHLLDRFAKIALGHVEKPYPHKLDHVYDSDLDAKTPRQLHPIFYGSFDWHSCVHSYWTLATALRLNPEGPHAEATRALFERAFTPENCVAEISYTARLSAKGFERPYGWAWFFKLLAELSLHPSPYYQRLAPLGDILRQRVLDYLQLSLFPIRTGVHSNTSFALRLIYDYAQRLQDQPLLEAIFQALAKWHERDAHLSLHEPSQDDFLSPVLTTAQALIITEVPSRLWHQTEAQWLADFMPMTWLRSTEAKPKFSPVTPPDRSDGKMAHLDGLNLSRAYALFDIASVLGSESKASCLALAHQHLEPGLSSIEGDFMGEHWLASFALLALIAADLES